MECGWERTDSGRVKAEIILIAWLLILIVLYASLATAAPIDSPNAAQVSNITYRPSRLVYLQAEGEAFKKPTGVFVDRATGEVVVTDNGSNLVTVLSREGVPLFAVGYNRELPQPSQAVVDGQGRLLVLAGVPRKVKVFSYRGEPLGDYPFAGFDGAAAVIPTAMTVDRTGNLYVADGTSGRILVYSPEGNLLHTIGKRGQEPGAFSTVTAISVDQAGTIYVADAQHKPAIQLFDAQGNYLRGWGEHSSGPQNVSLPSGIAVTPGGHVLVVDTLRQTIAVFTPDGRYLGRFGGMGGGPGDLAFPSGLATDSTGRLYVTEIANARLQVFEPSLTQGRSGKSGNGSSASQPGREEARQGLNDLVKSIRQ